MPSDSARGGGGNTVRNVSACARTGVCPSQVFDVAPYSIALAEYLIQDRSSFNLPRKFKIAFSGCGEDCPGAGVNDVGFVALNGGFKLICGGGMGAKSAVGKVLQENVKGEEIGYIVNRESLEPYSILYKIKPM